MTCSKEFAEQIHYVSDLSCKKLSRSNGMNLFVLTIPAFHLPTILQTPYGNLAWNVWAMNNDSLRIDVSLILETAGKAAIIRANTRYQENSGHTARFWTCFIGIYVQSWIHTSHKANLNFHNGGSSTSSQGKTWIRLEEDKQIDLKSYSVSPTWESKNGCDKSNSLVYPSVTYHWKSDTIDIGVVLYWIILDHLGELSNSTNQRTFR